MSRWIDGSASPCLCQWHLGRRHTSTLCPYATGKGGADGVGEGAEAALYEAVLLGEERCRRRRGRSLVPEGVA